MDDAIDRDDIARVLLALQNKNPSRQAEVAPALAGVIEEYVSPDLSHIAKALEITTVENFPIRLDIGAPILKGGGGIVIQATNRDVSSLKYALKSQRPSLLRSKTAVIDSERAYAEYIYHAPLASQNVARLFAVQTIDVLNSAPEAVPNRVEIPLLILEWIDGAQPFSKYIKESVASAPVFIDIMRQCFSAVDHLHANGLIHWDIKSDNLLVDRSGTVKLMDIGNARRISSETPVDLVALTTEGNFPPILQPFAKIREEGDSSNRVQLELDSAKWDDPWLDLWMLARELAELIGIGEDADTPLFPDTPGVWKDGDPNFVARGFPSETADSDFSLRYARLILRRLLYPRSVESPRYYRVAAEVVHDLQKLLPEFGAAQGVPELRAIPQKVVRIPLSGNAPLTPRVKRLLSSDLVSRLRRHMQLGTISEVYPGVAHKRFEHSIGVFATVCDYIKALFSDRSNIFWRISIEAEDVEALLLAGLLHDVGHLAYGHFLEEMAGLFSDYTHECYAQAVLGNSRDIPQRGHPSPWEMSAQADREALLGLVVGNWGGDGEVADIVARAASILAEPKNDAGAGASPIFTPEAELLRDPSDKLKLEILHSIMDGAIDADKFDYLKRDGLHAGINYPQGIDGDRFLQSLTTLHKVARDSALSMGRDDGKPLSASIAVTEKGLLPVESILFARYQMFRAVYWHHTARAHTAMLQFCIVEYLRILEDRTNRAFLGLIDVFRRSTDDQAIAWLASEVRRLQAPTHEFLVDACEALGGAREKAYKECFVLRYKGNENTRSPKEVQEIYAGLMRDSIAFNEKSGMEYLNFYREFRTRFTERLAEKLNCRLEYGEILIDVPPAGRDQVRNIFIIDENGPHYVQELSPMAEAVSETFKLWARQFRVFCSPRLLERTGISRREIGRQCWAVLEDMYLAPKLDLPA